MRFFISRVLAIHSTLSQTRRMKGLGDVFRQSHVPMDVSVIRFIGNRGSQVSDKLGLSRRSALAPKLHFLWPDRARQLTKSLNTGSKYRGI